MRALLVVIVAACAAPPAGPASPPTRLEPSKSGGVNPQNLPPPNRQTPPIHGQYLPPGGGGPTTPPPAPPPRTGYWPPAFPAPVPSTPPVPPSGPCTKVKAADLKKKPSEHTAACVRIAFEKDHALAAKLIRAITWRDETKTILEKFAIAPRAWFAIAQMLDDKPRVAMSLLLLATKESDATLANEIDLSIIRLAIRLERSTGDVRGTENWDEVFRTAADRMLSRDALGSLQRARLLSYLVERGDKARRLYLCNERADSTIIWTCVGLPDADVDRSVAALANLPALTWDDLAAIEKATKGQLSGLRCKDGKPLSVPDVFAEVDKGRARRDEARLYFRLREAAPPRARDCLAQEAALACLREIQRDGRCTALSSFAVYMRLRPVEEQVKLIERLVILKSTEYQLLSRNVGRASMIFHVHLVLAEALFKLANPAKGVIWLPQYHVGRAFAFFKPESGSSIKFHLVVPKGVRAQVCADKDCRQVCRGERGCMESCRSEFSPAAVAAACP